MWGFKGEGYIEGHIKGEGIRGDGLKEKVQVFRLH